MTVKIDEGAKGTEPVEPVEPAKDGAEGANGTEGTDDKGEAGNVAEDGDKGGDESLDALPEWAQKAIKDLRRENAAARTARKAAEEKLESATTLEEFEAAKSEWQAANAELQTDLAKAKVINDFPHLPKDLHGMIAGTPEQMREAAEALMKHVAPGDPVRLSGGLSPDADGDEDSDDPAVLAKRYGRGAKRR